MKKQANKVFRQMSLELQGKVEARDVNLGVISIYVMSNPR